MSDETQEDAGGWLIDAAEPGATETAAPPEQPPAPVPHKEDDDTCACDVCKRVNDLCDDLADVTLDEKHKNLPVTLKLDAMIRVIAAINTEKSIPGQESHNGLSLVMGLAQRLLTGAERKQQQMVQRIMQRISENGGTLPIEISADSILQGGVFDTGHGNDGEPES